MKRPNLFNTHQPTTPQHTEQHTNDTAQEVNVLERGIWRLHLRAGIKPEIGNP